MLVATWMVRIVKTVTEVLKMLPRRGAGLGQAFQAAVFFYTDGP